jgi:hypothetical protein
MDWLRGKSVEWHQELYALLLTDHLMTARYQGKRFATKLKSLKIVRLIDCTYGIGGESFFVSDWFEHDEVLGRVDAGVYTTGKSKSQKENARAFLVEIGVREVGEAQLVEAILKRRYMREAEFRDERTYRKDLKRFIELVEKAPETAGLFAESFIFKCGDSWRIPGEVFLDRPFLDTGLSAYYGVLGDDADRYALSDSYQSYGVTAKHLVKFARAVGAAGRLEIQRTTCNANADYHIPELDALLKSPNAALSQLIWRTLSDQDDDSWTTAKYPNNCNRSTWTAPSQLICVLRDHAWVPQTDGRFVRPAEAASDCLPAGFAFDSGWTWLQAVHFGQQLAKKSEEHRQRQSLAKQLGFIDEDTLERAKRFAALPADEQRRILADRKSQVPFELPDQEPGNPSRAKRVAAEAVVAPKRLTEERTRSVSVGLDAVKQEAGQYLRQQYTKADGQMICQVCKNRLPFKLDDGSDYFECVEFLRGLKLRHQQNYLALCPNHAAMFQHANGSTDELRDLVVEMAGNELAVILAREDATIYFTKTHLADLKAIIGADQSEPVTKSQEPLHATGP